MRRAYCYSEDFLTFNDTDSVQQLRLHVRTGQEATPVDKELAHQGHAAPVEPFLLLPVLFCDWLGFQGVPRGAVGCTRLLYELMAQGGSFRGLRTGFGSGMFLLLYEYLDR